jgi:uncharacterized damage-inducible protein DinB
MSGTLNHLLVTDRNWMWRLTGHGLHYDRGDIVIVEDRRKLAAPASMKMSASSDTLPPWMRRHWRGCIPFVQRRCDILAHLFNLRLTIAAKRTRSSPS